MATSGYFHVAIDNLGQLLDEHRENVQRTVEH